MSMTAPLTDGSLTLIMETITTVKALPVRGKSTGKMTP